MLLTHLHSEVSDEEEVGSSSDEEGSSSNEEGSSSDEEGSSSEDEGGRRGRGEQRLRRVKPPSTLIRLRELDTCLNQCMLMFFSYDLCDFFRLRRSQGVHLRGVSLPFAWRRVPSSRGYFCTLPGGGTIIWGVLLYEELW